MAKRELIKELRSFFRLQAEERKTLASSDDDAIIIEKIIKKPNSGYLKAKKEGHSVTVSVGNKIYEIAADDTRTQVGTIRRKDVEIPQAPISIR